jgi:hypothetical protein
MEGIRIGTSPIGEGDHHATAITSIIIVADGNSVLNAQPTILEGLLIRAAKNFGAASAGLRVLSTYLRRFY